METSSSSTRVYSFDDLFFDIFKINFLRRKSPSAPLELYRSKTVILAMIALIIMTIGLIMNLFFIFYNSEYVFTDISAICEVGSVIVVSIGRGTCFFTKHVNINRLMKVSEDLFPVTREDQRRYQLESYAKRIIFRNRGMQMLITWSCLGYLAIAFVQSMFGTLILGEPFKFQYPFVTWYPFNAKRWALYPFIYALQIFTGMSTAVFYFYEECIFTSCVTQLCMHYRYLCELLRTIDARRVSNNGAGFGRLIRYQCILEGLQDDVNDSFSMSTFFGFTIIKIAICMFLFSTVYGQGLLEDLPLFMCVMTLVVPIYLRCNAGTILSDASGSVLGAIYDHNWYEGNVKYQKVVAIMMIKANKPKVLRASQLRQICMEYFKEIMVDTYQVFMFFFNFSH